jgi:hypothetical protein
VSRKQKTAIIALPVLVLTMIGVYRVAIRLLPADLAWYIGFPFYWPLWCILYPRWILGGVDIRRRLSPRGSCPDPAPVPGSTVSCGGIDRSAG